MLTVPVVIGYDQTKKIGTVTLDETQVPDGVDWILAMGYRVLERKEDGVENGQPVKIQLLEFGLIDVHQHAAIEPAGKRPSDASKWQAVARNIATSHPEGAAIFKRVAAAHGFTV